MVNFGTPFASSTFSRVSSTLARDVILGNLRRNQEDVLRVQEQIATGFRILRPSDDPVGANRVLDFQLTKKRNDQFIRNIDAANGRLELADGSIQQAGEIISKAREILLSQVQSTATSQTRLISAQEINLLLEQAVSLANTQFEDHFIFAGSRGDTAPLVFAGGGVAFRGDILDVRTQVAPGLQSPIHTNANDAFGVLSDEIRGLNLSTFTTIDVNPRVSVDTKLSVLNGGRGVSAGSVTVTGAAARTIDLAGADDVEDVITAINAQSSTTGVTASLAGSSLVLTRTGGGTIIVSEGAGGRTAQDLGIVTGVSGSASPITGTNLNPLLTADTRMGDLFSGAGLSLSGLTITQVNAGITFTATLGSSFFSGTARVEAFLNAVNNSGTFVQTQIDSSGTRIDVLSRLSGGRLTIGNAGTGTTATQLGLQSTLRRARLADLHGGLGVTTVPDVDIRITKKNGSQITFDIDPAATVNDVVNLIDADSGLTATVTGDSIVITDVTGGSGSLVVEDINGSFAAMNLGIAGSTTGSTITGSALSSAGVQVEGLFTALVRLRDALNQDNIAATRAAGRLLDRAQEKEQSSRATVGHRVNGLELVKNRLGLETDELQRLISEDRDVDMAEATTRFQLQSTVLQASLSVAARLLQNNLFDFLS